MKSVVDEATREELINRINTLHENSTAQWGKMNVYQMLKHCTLWEEMILGKRKVKRMLLGRLFGKLALKGVLKDDSPLRKNSPSSPELIINEQNGSITEQKKEWISKIAEYAHFNNPDFIHPFFGQMTKEQIGQFVYKHSDHHLRQFKA